MGQIIHSDEYYLIEIFDEFFSYLYPDYIHSEKLSKNVDFANISINKKLFPVCNKITISKDCVLYRARNLSLSNLLYNPNSKNEFEFWNNYISNYFNCSTCNELHKTYISTKIKEASLIDKRISSDLSNGYLGYNKEKCGAPPVELCNNEERCSGKKERVLYLADSINTCLLECNANRDVIYNMGEFVPKNSLSVYDITKNETNFFEIGISQAFSKVTQDNNYQRSQMIAKIICKLGYDGIKYHSAKNSRGYCYMFFNPSILDCVRSYYVKPIELLTRYIK